MATIKTLNHEDCGLMLYRVSSLRYATFDHDHQGIMILIRGELTEGE